jgi:N-glycosylase/DNA lyase
VWQIAQRDYKFGRGKHKSLTKTTYDGIGDHFRALWGKEAGWAHSVLFTADLRAFSERLVVKSEIKEESISVSNERVNVKIEETVTETVLTNSLNIKREATSDDEHEEKIVKAEDDARTLRAKKRRKV